MRDAQGHPLSGATGEAASAYEEGARAFVLVYGDALARFDAAIAASPQFSMAYLAKAWALLLANDPGTLALAKATVEAARPLERNEREQAHFAALSHAVGGARTSAAAILDRHLRGAPLDLVAHQAAMALDLWAGRPDLMSARPARAMPFWSRNQPGYGTILAYRGFGLEEMGEYRRAEDASREAAELEPCSFWPHHTVSHVMEETARPRDGLAWMAEREAFWASPGHVFQLHIWWHRALFHIELGKYDAALELYDGPVRATQRPVGTHLTNAPSLLWRLDALGCDVGNRWAELAALWQGHADGRSLVFTDIHAAMAELATGDHSAVARRVEAMRTTAGRGSEVSEAYARVGLPAVEGFAAFRSEAYGPAVDHLLRAQRELWRMGGSHAQRDVVAWTSIEAAIRAGYRDVALALAHERIAARPSSVPNQQWMERAEALPA
ncbi:tetratricopeptide repeat protein [Elioraea rosea]|uniref:tetratricopeptide repeat protein n=1 Tax=Elioraea rosea TaxID=2492390 RepID=UPI0011837A4A|nr:tetratricopeptide repeat protein [Elioraea rosea]